MQHRYACDGPQKERRGTLECMYKSVYKVCFVSFFFFFYLSDKQGMTF